MPLNLEQPKRKQAISLTPLIDVVFILLLFFMLTSSFVPWRVLDTPLAVHTPPQEQDQQEQEIITLTLQQNDGQVWLDDKAISLSDPQAFTSLVSDSAEAVFVVKADSGVTLQSLLKLADTLKLHGAQTVSIANAFDMPETP